MASTRVSAGPGSTAFVLGGGGVLGAAEVGMLRALFEHGIRPDLIVGTSVRAINGALVAVDPTPSAVARGVGRADLRGDPRRVRAGSCRDAGSDPHAPAPEGAVARPAHASSARRHLRRARSPLPVRPGQHRAGGRALVHRRRPGAGGARLLGHPGPVAAGRARWRALPGRRAGAQHPGGPGGRAGGGDHLRAARRPDRPPAASAGSALGGRDGRLRDRPATPVRRRPGGVAPGRDAARPALGGGGPTFGR
jgi:hypothetical protein